MQKFLATLLNDVKHNPDYIHSKLTCDGIGRIGETIET